MGGERRAGDMDLTRARRPRTLRDGRHRGRRPGPALLLVRHHRASPRASCTRTATCSRTRSSSSATTCATASCSTARASGRGPPASARCSGRGATARWQLVQARKGGYDPEEHLRFLSKHGVENMFTTPTALRAMTGVADAGKRYPLEQLRITCSAGEPLNPEVIRWFREQFGITVLDYYGLTESYPLCGNFPTVEVREGSMGLPMPGWDVAILDEDEQPLPPGERGEICLRARSNPHYPIGYWNRPEDTEEVFGGEWFHTKDAAQTRRGRLRLVRRPRRRRDHLRRLPDRAVRGGVGVRRAPGREGGGRGGLTRRAARQHREGVHRARRGRTSRATSSPTRSRPRARAPLRLRLSARDRVRGRPAEDAHRQDPAGGAARAGVPALPRPRQAGRVSFAAGPSRSRRRAARSSRGSSAPSGSARPARASSPRRPRSRPAARAASTVSSVWLIVPRPGRAAITSGSARSTARSRTR